MCTSYVRTVNCDVQHRIDSTENELCKYYTRHGHIGVCSVYGRRDCLYVYSHDYLFRHITVVFSFHFVPFAQAAPNCFAWRGQLFDRINNYIYEYNLAVTQTHRI